ncbi:MAG TPA: DinB family protein [Longimicrobium sp.]|jgi:hypothetical protein
MQRKLAEVAAELDRTRAVVLANFDGLDQDALDRRPAESAWSVGEAAHHLSLVERGVVRLLGPLLHSAIAAGLPPAPADAESVVGSLDRFRIEERRRRVDARESAIPTHGLPRAELLAALAASRAGLMELVDAAAPHDVSGVVHKHPALGDLNLYEWFVFVGKHELRHAAQMSEARQGIASEA